MKTEVTNGNRGWRAQTIVPLPNAMRLSIITRRNTDGRVVHIILAEHTEVDKIEHTYQQDYSSVKDADYQPHTLTKEAVIKAHNEINIDNEILKALAFYTGKF